MEESHKTHRPHIKVGKDEEKKRRVDPYLWTDLAPVLECSVSRRRHPRKGMSIDRVCVVFVARVDRRIFLLFAKNGLLVGARSLNVTAGH